jgi:hypothetical protein
MKLVTGPDASHQRLAELWARSIRVWDANRQKASPGVTLLGSMLVPNMGWMDATLITMKAVSRSFRPSLIVSLVISVLSIALPFVTAHGSMDGAIKLSMFLSFIWVVWVTLAFAKFKWRALWFLLGLPLAGWWLVVLYLIAAGCAHNLKNCP